jgi:hypothetical protein
MRMTTTNDYIASALDDADRATGLAAGSGTPESVQAQVVALSAITQALCAVAKAISERGI